MTTKKQDDSGVPVHIRKLLRAQREANERLVLATIQAHNMRVQAENAAHLAEEALKSAEVAKKLAQAIAEDFAKRESELRATAAFREQLLGIVGHDLRNPLNAIVMSALHLERHGTLSATDAKSVERIRDSAQRMTRMIAQLVEFTRARLGCGLALDLRPTNFTEVCRQVIDELEVGAQARVHSEFQGELTGTWDADRLAQALSNIIANAIDHAALGTTVLITASESGGDICVEIANQGDTIAPDELAVIFQPFRRGHYSGRSPEQSSLRHLGLGLYIAHQAVSVHGGTLTARSEGGTTTFAIRLQRAPPAASC